MDFSQDKNSLKCNFLFDRSKPGSNPFEESDQAKGLPAPEAEKPFDESNLLLLPDPKATALKTRDVTEVIASRKTRRRLDAGSVGIDGLSYILWAVMGAEQGDNGRLRRTVPSAGARYPFDAYFFASAVDGLESGLYHYIWSKHAVLPIPVSGDSMEKLKKQWPCAFSVLLAAVPYRSEWRYLSHAYRFIAMDAGHAAQNGYLAAEALGIGCCAIGGYPQTELDSLLGLDGENEFICYAEIFGRYE